MRGIIDTTVLQLLERIASALEHLGKPQTAALGLEEDVHAYIWHADPGHLEAVRQVNRIPLGLLVGIDQIRDILLDNTKRFATGLPANNTLLWGARGTGKSSLIKAVHAQINACQSPSSQPPLILIEIHREDISSLPELMTRLRDKSHRFIIFCDDLSFSPEDTSYKSLKAVLEGGIEGRPANVVFYATSNRRHLMPRDMMENERSTAINPAEAVEEKVSLSDRFGLWLGFHNCSQNDYLAMVTAYVEHFGLQAKPEDVRAAALEWAATRGARSGRVAWQFIQDLAGRLGQRLNGTQNTHS